jgi:predicted nucleic acid-binding Zn ribbon protein
MQKISDPSLKSCPECGSKKIARLVSRTSFQLKGGGWYADLYSSPRKDAGQSKGRESSNDAGPTAPPPAAPSGGPKAEAVSSHTSAPAGSSPTVASRDKPPKKSRGKHQ